MPAEAVLGVNATPAVCVSVEEAEQVEVVELCHSNVVVSGPEYATVAVSAEAVWPVV